MDSIFTSWFVVNLSIVRSPFPLLTKTIKYRPWRNGLCRRGSYGNILTASRSRSQRARITKVTTWSVQEESNRNVGNVKSKSIVDAIWRSGDVNSYPCS
jgi:hypothetical protein